MKAIRYTLEEINVGKFKTVRHYQLKEIEGRNILKSDILSISNNRAYANSQPVYWLKAFDGKKWGKNLTGLFKTQEENTFFGDLEYKRHLILVHLEGKVMKVKIYEKYYPFHKNDHPTTMGKKIGFYKVR